MSQTITVTIYENEAGEIEQSVDLAGYQGKGCHAVQQSFEEAVGPSTKVTKKPEFYQEQVKKNFLSR